MEKFTAFIEKHIAPMANKLGRNKYVVALQNSFFAMIPFITVGALALVLISPPADYTTMDPGVARSLMQGWQAFADFTGPTFNFINMVTMNLLAFWIALGMGLNLAKHHKMTPAMPILVTTMSFLIWATMNPDGSLTFDYLGGTGLFVALVASILSFELYRTLTEKKVGHIDLSGCRSSSSTGRFPWKPAPGCDHLPDLRCIRTDHHEHHRCSAAGTDDHPHVPAARTGRQYWRNHLPGCFCHDSVVVRYP